MSETVGTEVKDKYEWDKENAEAIYTESPVDFWKGNPLIEALPEILPDEELCFHLRSKCRIERDKLAELPEAVRCICVDQLYDVFQPWDVHIRIARNLESAIRGGYTNRNPLKIDFVKQQRLVASHIEKKDATFSGLTNNAKAPGFAIIGLSGMGKTTGIKRALAQYPQVITHSSYNGIPFPFTQIVWMRLNCPFDSSVKGLCIEFFQEFDRITGDNTYQRFAMSSRATTDIMLPQMALLASRHGLGALVIDEIQNLSERKSRGKEQMLNFFTQLVNKIGVPVILVGTQAAVETLTSDVATARRFSGPNGAVIMNLLSADSDGWEMLLGGLQKQQWTTEEANLLDESIQKVLHQETKGMVAHVVNLLVQAQKAAIQSGRNKIDAKLISSVAHSDDNLMMRTLLNKLGQMTLSKTTDRDFMLEITRLRANTSSVESNISCDKIEDSTEKQEPVEAPKRQKSKKKELPDLNADIVKKGDEQF